MAQLFFLDDDQDLREAMRDVLSALGHEAVCAGSVREMQALGNEVLACDLALLDLNLGAGQPSGLDAQRYLRERGFGRPIVFLTGHGRSLDRPEDIEGEAPVFEKPMSLDSLVQLLQDASS